MRSEELQSRLHDLWLYPNSSILPSALATNRFSGKFRKT
jgi:hypothetical protein